MARRTRRIPKPWPKVRRSLYPTGWPQNMLAVLYLNGRQQPADSAQPVPDPYGPDIAPTPINFDDWWRNWAISSYTTDSFTNAGTGGVVIQIDDLTPGKTYEVTADVTYGSGTLRFTTTDDYDTTTPNQVHEFSGSGKETFELLAGGNKIMFRISIAQTTTTVNSLSIREVLGS